MANPLYGQNKADSELAKVADKSSYLGSISATGTIDSSLVRCIEIAGAGSGVIAVTGVKGTDWKGQFVTVIDMSSSGTDAHTVTITDGTWDGTNNTLTFNAPKEFICFYFNNSGVGTIVENVGSVALSSV
tara:strand:+ start:11501 stop:11890 length:390 start_codon:yes stop_codon:yes gene_type:complete